MNILSLFDWISCGRLALERAGIKVDKYFASEVDKYAIQIAKKNYLDTIHIGSVTDVRYTWKALEYNIRDVEPYREVTTIDMIIWWSPCQDLSIAKKDWKGLQGEKSSLFFEYVRLLKEVKPKYFLLENVASMKKAEKEEITRILTEIYPDTQCYLINSALVSAQNRKRLYWTNIQWVKQPEDNGILLKDILEENVDEKYYVDRYWYEQSENYIQNAKNIDKNKILRLWQFNSWWQWDRVYSPEWKSVSLSANGGGRGAKTGLYEFPNEHMTNVVIRKLTPIECERLQTLPDNWTEWISNTQRYKAIWNGWTVDVIKHIFTHI